MIDIKKLSNEVKIAKRKLRDAESEEAEKTTPPAYQWIIINNQVMSGFTQYMLTPKFYSSREAVDKDWAPENTEYCFHPVAPLEISRVTGLIAQMVTRHEDV